MKKITLLFMFSVIGKLYAQGGSVVITSGGAAPATNLDPQTQYSYTASSVVAPTGYTFSSRIWQPTGDHTPTTGTASYTSSTAYISWQNIPNIVSSQYSHKLKLKVTFVKSGSPNIVLTSNEIPITVRYLSPFTSLAIAGTNVANNGLYNLPCGVTNLSVIASNLTTDPVQNIIYTWTKPAGWSGPNTTTNTGIATFTSNAGTGGVFKVTGKRIDNNLTQTWTINVTRPIAAVATISGVSPEIICVGQTKTLTSTSTNATSYTWTPVGGVSIVSGQGTNTISYNASTNGSAGSFTVKGNNGCGSGSSSVSRTIFRGTPIIQSATVDNNPIQMPNYVNYVGQMYLSTIGGTSANWTLLNGNGTIYPSGLLCQGYPSNFIQVYGVTNNVCGNGETRTFYLQLQGTSMFKIASENPSTTGIIDVELIDAVVGEELLKEASITSENQKEKVVFDLQKAKNEKHFSKSKKFSLDISKSPKGTFYLNLVIGDTKYTERIIY